MTMTTLDVGSLRQALRVALPFTDRTGMPVMECVHLEAAHKNLVVTASDRYVLGTLRTLAAGDPLPPTLIHRRDVRLIRRALDEQPGNHAVHIRRVRRLDGPDQMEVATSELTIRVKVLDAKYPDVIRLFSATEQPGLDTPVNIDPTRARPFAKAAKTLGTTHVRWTFHGPKKPIRVEIGRTFAGLIMPRSFPDHYDAASVPVGLVEQTPRTREYA